MKEKINYGRFKKINFKVVSHKKAIFTKRYELKKKLRNFNFLCTKYIAIFWI